MKKKNYLAIAKRILIGIMCVAILIPNLAIDMNAHAEGTGEVSPQNDEETVEEYKEEAPAEKEEPAPEQTPVVETPAPQGTPGDNADETPATPENGTDGKTTEAQTPAATTEKQEQVEPTKTVSGNEAADETEKTKEAVETVSENAVETVSENEVVTVSENEIEEVSFDASETIDGIVIKVTADKGVFPEGSTLKVAKVSNTQVKTAVENATADNVTVKPVVAFDITIVDEDDNEIQPDTDKGDVKVTFENVNTAEADRKANTDIKVYHVEDNMRKAEPVSASAGNGEVSFDAEHFSIYAIASTTETVGENVVEAKELVNHMTMTDAKGNEINKDHNEVALNTPYTFTYFLREPLYIANDEEGKPPVVIPNDDDGKTDYYYVKRGSTYNLPNVPNILQTAQSVGGASVDESGNLSWDVTATAGEGDDSTTFTFATVTIDKEGNATLTVKDDISKDVEFLKNCKFGFTATLDESKIENLTKIPVQFGDTFSLELSIPQADPVPPTLTKTKGEINGKQITWMVTITNDANPVIYKDGITLTDTMSTNQSFGSITSYTVNEAKVDAPTVTTTDNGFTIPYDNMTPGAVTVITYTTTMKEDVFTNKETYGDNLVFGSNYSNGATATATAKFQNQAVLKNNTDNKNVTDIKHANNQTTQSYTMGMDKKGGTIVDIGNNKGSIDWTITITNGDSAITNAILYDKFAKDTSGVYGDADKWSMSLDINSIQVKGNSPYSINQSATTDKENDWSIRFDSIAAKETITITYTTIINNLDRVMTGNFWGEWGKKPSNSAWLEYTYTPGEGAGNGKPMDMVGPTVTKDANGIGTMFDKAKGAVPYDAATRTFSWKLIANHGGREIKNAKIIDELPAGHEYVSIGDITVVHNDGKSASTTISSADITTSTVTRDGEEHVQVTFPLGNINDKVSIEIKTKLTDEEYKKLFTADRTSSVSKKYRNYGYLYSGDKELARDYEDISATNNLITKNLVGSYDYTKHTMQWQILVNDSMMKLNGMVVTDILDQNLKLVSLEVKNGTEVARPNYTYDEETGKVVVTLDDVPADAEGKESAKRTILITTKVKDDSTKLLETNGATSVKNTASLYTDTYGTTIKSNEAECSFTNRVLRKGGQVVEDNQVNYSIYINEAKTIIPSDAKITDIMKKGLSLDPSSLALHYATTVDGAYQAIGELVDKSSYQISHSLNAATGETTIELTLPAVENDTNTYVLTYTATAVIGAGYKDGDYDNSVTTTGYNISYGSDTKVSFMADTFSSSDSGGYKYAQINKQETGNPDLKLNGAVFTLYQQDENGDWINKGEYATGRDGSGLINIKVKMDNDNAWKVVETIAPTGHVLNEGEDSNEYMLTFADKPGQSNAKPIVITNDKAPITFTKVDTNGNALRGAVFAIYKVDTDGLETEVGRYTSTTNGKVLFTPEKGTYHIREVEAPAGYYLSDIVLEATVSETGEVDGPYVLDTETGTVGTDKITQVENVRRPGTTTDDDTDGGTSNGGGGTTTTTTTTTGTTTTTPTGEVLGANRTIDPSTVTIPDGETPLAPGVLGADRLPKTGGFWGTGIIYMIGAGFILAGAFLFILDQKKRQTMLSKITKDNKQM